MELLFFIFIGLPIAIFLLNVMVTLIVVVIQGIFGKR